MDAKGQSRPSETSSRLHLAVHLQPLASLFLPTTTGSWPCFRMVAKSSEAGWPASLQLLLVQQVALSFFCIITRASMCSDASGSIETQTTVLAQSSKSSRHQMHQRNLRAESDDLVRRAHGSRMEGAASCQTFAQL